MGYSNNKWRKILTILMIINLCFILFAKFTKVFGADIVYISLENQTYTLPDFSYLSEENSDYPVSVIVKRSSGTWLFFTKQIEYNGLYTPYFGVVPKPASNTGYNFYFMNYEKNYLLSNNNWVLTNSGLNNNSLISLNMLDFIASNIDIKDSSGNTTYFYANINSFYAPYFENVTEIENGYPDGVYISIQDYDKNENLYFHLLQVDSESLPTPGNSVFYYSDNMFQLNKDSSYYKTFDGDDDGNLSYYYIPRYELSFNMNTSYVYVLTSSSDPINNSYNHIEKDIENGIYDVIESDTTGVMTATDLESDRLNRIEQETVNQANNTNSINNSLSNTTPDTNISNDIDNSLNFNNSNEGLNNLNGGFFTRLTTMLSNLLGYNLAEDTSVSIPLPNSNNSITLHSIDIYNNVTGAIRLIINAFWVYIFSFYMWRFINKIYIAVSTGNILDTFSSSGEAITNDML